MARRPAINALGRIGRATLKKASDANGLATGHDQAAGHAHDVDIPRLYHWPERFPAAAREILDRIVCIYLDEGDRA